MSSIAKVALLSFFTFCCISPTHADWPHWRGPNRDDVVAESSGFANGKWNINKERWTINTGAGSSSPLLVGDDVYAMGWKSGKDFVYCIDANTGRVRWTASYRCPLYARYSAGDKGQYSGPSSTPEFDEKTGFLYTLSTDGDLHCWNTGKKGERVWRKNLYDEFGAKQRPRLTRKPMRDYGYTTAPLVHHDWLIVEIGAKKGSLAAFDKHSGKLLWTSKHSDPAGHTGGLAPMMIEGVPCVAVLTQKGLLVVRLDTENAGKTAAYYPWITDFANNIPTPSVQGPFVLITTAYNKKAICKLRITLKGADKMWEQPYPSGVCSPVIHNGHVYYAYHRFVCLDFQTGKLNWSSRGFSAAASCIVTKDDRLIIWANRGDLILAETMKRSPSRYKEVSRKSVFRSLAWPHVVLANGKLICKDRTGNIRCLNVR